MRVAPEIELTPEEQSELMKLARSERTSVRLAQRARIVLLAPEGMQNKDIAASWAWGGASRALARALRESRLAGIERDLPRGAPPAKVDVARLVALTTQTKPEAATHWSTRTMAAELGRQRSERLAALARQRPEAAPGAQASRSRAIRSSSRSWRTSSACTCPRPSTRWCCAATRRARSRRSTARSRACR